MNCAFCQLIEGSTYDPKYSNGLCAVIEPLEPIAPGHLIVASISHIHDVSQDPYTAAKAMETAANIARRIGTVDIITSTGPMPLQHLRLHVVPRTSGVTVDLASLRGR